MALAMGVGISLVSALAPASEASLVSPVEAMARGRREHETRVHRWRDLLIAVASGSCAWLASRQQPVGGKPLVRLSGRVTADRGASALAIPALVSDCRRHRRAFAPRLRSGSAARGAQPGGIAAPHVRAGAALGHSHRDARRGRHHGRQFSSDRAALDGRPPASGSVSAARRSPRRRPSSDLAAGYRRRLRSSPKSPPWINSAPMRSATRECRPRWAAATRGLPARYGRRPFLSGADPQTVFRQLIGERQRRSSASHLPTNITSDRATKSGTHAGRERRVLSA